MTRGAFHHNGGNGLKLAPFDPRPGRAPPVERVVLSDVVSQANGSALRVGSVDVGERGQHKYDFLNSSSASEITVLRLRSSDNEGYGTFMFAARSLMRDCSSTNDGARVSHGAAGFGVGGNGTQLVGCSVTGRQTFGYDCGTAFNGGLVDCSAEGVGTAFNLGSFQNLRCRGLRATDCTRALNSGRVELANGLFTVMASSTWSREVWRLTT